MPLARRTWHISEPKSSGDLSRNCFDMFFPVKSTVNLKANLFGFFDDINLFVAYL